MQELKFDLGAHVSAAMQAYYRRLQFEKGIHEVCDGVFFVTNQKTVEALRNYFEETMTFMGVKVMTPKQTKIP